MAPTRSAVTQSSAASFLSCVCNRLVPLAGATTNITIPLLVREW